MRKRRNELCSSIRFQSWNRMWKLNRTTCILKNNIYISYYFLFFYFTISFSHQCHSHSHPTPSPVSFHDGQCQPPLATTECRLLPSDLPLVVSWAWIMTHPSIGRFRGCGQWTRQIFHLSSAFPLDRPSSTTTSLSVIIWRRPSLDLSSLNLFSLLSFGIRHSSDLSLIQPSSDLRSPSRLVSIRLRSLLISHFSFSML